MGTSVSPCPEEVQIKKNVVNAHSIARTAGAYNRSFQLNLSALYGIGGARRGCVARVKGVLGVV